MTKNLTQCCECKKIKIKNFWISKSNPIYYPIIFGYRLMKRIADTYCPPCQPRAREALNLDE